MPDSRLDAASAGKGTRTRFLAQPFGTNVPPSSGNGSSRNSREDCVASASSYLSPVLQRAPSSPSSSVATAATASPFLPPGQLALPDVSKLSSTEARFWDSLPEFTTPAVPGVTHPYYGLVDSRLSPNLVQHLRNIKKATAISDRTRTGSASVASSVKTGASAGFDRSVNWRLAKDAANSTQAKSARQSLEIQTSNDYVQGLRRLQTDRSTPASSRLSPMAEDAQANLRQAAENGDLDTVLRLLKQFREGELWELSVNQPVETTGMTALHYAAARGHTEVVRELCEEGGAVIDLPDLEGETALMKAAYGGHLDVVKWLINNGADVQRGDRDGWTPLHNAAGRGHLNVVRYLVEQAGAPVDAKSHQGHTPLMNAASTGHAEIVRCLLATESSQPFSYNEFSECAYDVAAIGLHARVCDILEKAERSIWDDIAQSDETMPPYDPVAVHTTQLVSLYENQRARPRQRSAASVVGAALAHRLSFFSRSRSHSGSGGPVSPPGTDSSSLSSAFHDSDFSPANLIHGDPAQMTDSSMTPRRLRDISLPRAPQDGLDWFWLSDWTTFVDSKLSADYITGAHIQHTDTNGWQYSTQGFNSPGMVWTSYIPSDAKDCVRKRQWVRAMKRQVPLDNPKAILATNPILTKLSSICNAETGSKESILVSHSTPKQVAQIDYLETARSILDSIRDADDVDSADTRELELKHAQHAVSILLSNIAIDDNSDRVLAARKLADDVLKRAETLSQELQSTTHDALTHTLNESENALGISDTAAAEPTTMPDTTDTSQKDSIASLPGATIGSDSQDVQGAKSTKDQMQMYLTQAEEELGPAATSPVEPIAKDEVVGDSEDERLFAKTVRDMKHSKSAREDPLPGVAAAITTEGANASESNDPQTTQAAANEAQDGSGGNSQAALPSRSNEPVSDEEHGEESEADGSTSESDGIQTNYPRSALLMRQCLPESAWEPDEATATCHKCERRFTLFLRRHHCRRCGLVFCDSCSSKRILLASPIGPAQSGYYGSALALEGNHLDIQEQLLTGRPNVMYWQFRDHRACDPCDGAVQSLPDAAADRVVALPRDLGASGTAENAYNIFRDTDAADSSREAAGIHDRHHRHGSDGANPYTLHRRRDSSSSIRVCPVCDKDWATVWHAMDRVPGEGWQEAQERHIRECIEDTSAEMQGSHGPRHSGIRRSRSIHAQSGAGSSAGSAAARGVGVSESTSQNRRSGGGFLAFFDRISSPEPDASGSNGDSDRGQQAAGSSTTSSQPLGINTGNSSGSRSGDADESHSAHLSRSARSPMGVKYIVYKLNGDTPLLGQECAICFEDFEPGQHVARLNCLCTYHFECISQWLQRTPACPVHYE